MATEVPGIFKKFCFEEVDFKSPVSEGLLTNVAAVINALCECAFEVDSRLFTSSGNWAVPDNLKWVIPVAVGGGGGGGGEAGFSAGGNVAGSNGSNGGLTIFDGVSIAGGGRGGLAGSTNFSAGTGFQSGNLTGAGSSFFGSQYGLGGRGGLGSSSAQNGHAGQTGPIGFSFIQASSLSGVGVPVVIGSGGAGGSGGTGVGDVGNSGSSGSNGALVLIYGVGK